MGLTVIVLLFLGIPALIIAVLAGLACYGHYRGDVNGTNLQYIAYWVNSFVDSMPKGGSGGGHGVDTYDGGGGGE